MCLSGKRSISRLPLLLDEPLERTVNQGGTGGWGNLCLNQCLLYSVLNRLAHRRQKVFTKMEEIQAMLRISSTFPGPRLCLWL